MQGTKIWACEVFIEEYDGDQLQRRHDEQTGLYLWDSSSLL
jgi:predicted DNA-binding protein with PD1-like motif